MRPQYSLRNTAATRVSVKFCQQLRGGCAKKILCDDELN
jgi:hypothetical protein